MRKGFTLIELVMVIVIIGILAAVAIPRFVDLTTQAKQGATQGALGAVRSAISIWYVQNVAAGNSARWPTSTAEIAGAMSDGLIPANPAVDASISTNVSLVNSNPTATANAAWIYNSSNGRVWAGNDTSW